MVLGLTAAADAEFSDDKRGTHIGATGARVVVVAILMISLSVTIEPRPWLL